VLRRTIRTVADFTIIDVAVTTVRDVVELARLCIARVVLRVSNIVTNLADLVAVHDIVAAELELADCVATVVIHGVTVIARLTWTDNTVTARSERTTVTTRIRIVLVTVIACFTVIDRCVTAVRDVIKLTRLRVARVVFKISDIVTNLTRFLTIHDIVATERTRHVRRLAR
jgi:hypothetical protein